MLLVERDYTGTQISGLSVKSQKELPQCFPYGSTVVTLSGIMQMSLLLKCVEDLQVIDVVFDIKYRVSASIWPHLVAC